MKKGLIAIVVAAVVAVGGVGGYMMYQKKAEEKAYNEEVKKAINSLPSIVVYEKEDLPTVESEFANAGSCIDINSVELESCCFFVAPEICILYMQKNKGGRKK